MLTKKSDSGITITHEQKDEFDITSVRITVNKGVISCWSQHQFGEEILNQ